MPKINVAFKNQPILNLAIDDTELGHRYVGLVKDNYLKQFPVFRDSAKYTVEYMHGLAEQAKKELNWNWSHDTYSVDITTQLFGMGKTLIQDQKKLNDSLILIDDLKYSSRCYFDSKNLKYQKFN